MSLELYLAFVAASALLILTPGPMVAFVIATTLSRGLRQGLVAVAGSTLASAIHLGVVAVGLAALLGAAGETFFLDQMDRGFLSSLSRHPRLARRTGSAGGRSGCCAIFVAPDFFRSIFGQSHQSQRAFVSRCISAALHFAFRACGPAAFPAGGDFSGGWRCAGQCLGAHGGPVAANTRAGRALAQSRHGRRFDDRRRRPGAGAKIDRKPIRRRHRIPAFKNQSS